MKPFLPDATDFTDMEVKPHPSERWKDRVGDIPCPKCHGYGGWRLILNAYGPGKHFTASCSQCNGWGYVKPGVDAECIHTWHELSQKTCRERRIAHYGMFCHVYECAKCGRLTETDSSG